ncbi:hypothetical protein [Cellulomonas sp. URHD0024]|uniref:TlpA family protein disulfide reductase n=1 Tax=Cellulomonas sp. URHD0024 TaxID=1302620 RepID=UPI0003FE05D7|nr:hypothetical protein [Cellulomonas sp. URHD0024]
MPYLVAAVVVLTALVLVNLALTGAIVRRLRADERRALGPDLPRALLGVDVSDKVAPSGRVLVAFSSTTCEGCVRDAPDLVARVPELADAGVSVVPVLLDSGPDSQHIGRTLAGAGAVVHQSSMDDWFAAFGVPGTPTYVLVEDGRTVAADRTLQGCLAASVPAR